MTTRDRQFALCKRALEHCPRAFRMHTRAGELRGIVLALTKLMADLPDETREKYASWMDASREKVKQNKKDLEDLDAKYKEIIEELSETPGSGEGGRVKPRGIGAQSQAPPSPTERER